MAAMERFSKSQVADRSDSVPTTLHHLETRDASSLIFQADLRNYARVV